MVANRQITVLIANKKQAPPHRQLMAFCLAFTLVSILILISVSQGDHLLHRQFSILNKDLKQATIAGDIPVQLDNRVSAEIDLLTAEQLNVFSIQHGNVTTIQIRDSTANKPEQIYLDLISKDRANLAPDLAVTRDWDQTTFERTLNELFDLESTATRIRADPVLNQVELSRNVQELLDAENSPHDLTLDEANTMKYRLDSFNDLVGRVNFQIWQALYLSIFLGVLLIVGIYYHFVLTRRRLNFGLVVALFLHAFLVLNILDLAIATPNLTSVGHDMIGRTMAHSDELQRVARMQVLLRRWMFHESISAQSMDWDNLVSSLYHLPKDASFDAFAKEVETWHDNHVALPDLSTQARWETESVTYGDELIKNADAPGSLADALREQVLPYYSSMMLPIIATLGLAQIGCVWLGLRPRIREYLK